MAAEREPGQRNDEQTLTQPQTGKLHKDACQRDQRPSRGPW
ncbi:hypothetical protein [Kibdelosporangium philippinense]|nr:hypothetical protein [Kibdelosporangium philippinense]